MAFSTRDSAAVLSATFLIVLTAAASAQTGSEETSEFEATSSGAAAAPSGEASSGLGDPSPAAGGPEDDTGGSSEHCPQTFGHTSGSEKSGQMPKKRFMDEQIAFALRQAEAGTTVGEICSKMGVAEATFYRSKKIYAGMGESEVRRLMQLEEENSKLMRLVADLMLEQDDVAGCPGKKW